VGGWVVTLSTVAEWNPQTAYAGFTFCMQNEWQYVQRVVADTAPFFSSPEEVIRTHFLPALLGVPSVEIDGIRIVRGRGNYHPIIFFWRYSKTKLVRPFVIISRNCLTVSILCNCTYLLKISSQNQIVLIVYYLLRGVNCGGRVFANTSAPELSLCVDTFMVAFLIGRLQILSTN
jgi:hypothetical protein